MHSLILDDQLANTVIAGTQKVLGTMFGVKVEPEPFRIDRDFIVEGDISGLIGMVQEKMEAALIVSFPKEVIFHVLSGMFRRTFTDVDGHVKNGVGELTNIIHSMLKTSLNARGYEFKPAIPNVITGKGHTISNLHTGNALIIPFKTEAGRFHVEIVVQNHSAGI